MWPLRPHIEPPHATSKGDNFSSLATLTITVFKVLEVGLEVRDLRAVSTARGNQSRIPISMCSPNLSTGRVGVSFDPARRNGTMCPCASKLKGGAKRQLRGKNATQRNPEGK